MTRMSEELAISRRAAGLSLSEVGRRANVSHHVVARIERGDPGSMSIDAVARIAAVVGLRLSASLHPDGDAVRDRGHLALLERFRSRRGPSVTFRAEVPMPIEGDRRSADCVIADGAHGLEAIVEAETRLDDVQALERAIAGKQRDLGISRAILLVADTKHNRTVIAATPELRRRFPVDTRTCLAALKAGRDPGGDALVAL